MAEDRKKPLGKVVQKKFYHVFNDKSAARRMLFSAALVVAPTIGVSTIYNDSPSSELPAGTVSAAALYKAEVDTLSKEIPSTTFTLDKSGARQQRTLKQAEKASDLEKRVDDFSMRLMWETKLSEREAKEIASSFRNAFGQSIQNANINWIDSYAAYMNEGRATLAKDPAPDTVEDMKMQMFQEHIKDRAWSSFMAFALFFSIFDSFLKRGLSHGRRRDDENIHEEKVEKFEDVKNDLKNLLKPGTPPKP